VNSNTPAFGVRIAKAGRRDLPYVAVNTLDPSTVPADYEKNAGSTATLLAQISAVREDRLSDFESAPLEDLAAINKAVEALETSYETPSSTVGMRLRQVIVQDGMGQDVALTPLQSAGFSAVLQERLEEERERFPKHRKRPRGFLGLGGANPQNVGRHVRAMGDPLWFRAPIEDLAVRKALAIHYRGISFSIPKAQLHDYYGWRQPIVERHRGVFSSDLDTRNIETGKLRDMVRAVLAHAADAAALQEEYREYLPEGRTVSAGLPRIQQGLMDKTLRDGGWVREFARELYRGLLDARLYIRGEWRTLGIGQIESERWIGILEDLIREVGR
jgi:hypothetical protein